MRQQSDTEQQASETEVREPGPGGMLNSRLAAGLRHDQQMLVQAACNRMAEIRRAIENGLAWEFENEDLLLGESEVLGEQTLLLQRNQTLSEVIAGLANIIDLIIAGQVEVGQFLEPNEILAGIFFETQTHMISYGQYAESQRIETHPLMGRRFLPWIRGSRATGVSIIYEPHDYIRFDALSGAVLPSGSVHWWAPIHPICNPTTAVEESVTAPTIRRYSEYWIHLPDPIHHPTVIDGLFRGSPPSSIYMTPPTEHGPDFVRLGDSYPLIREGRQYFYMLGERRIDLPNIESQYPQLH